jgi:hypothetical protein
VSARRDCGRTWTTPTVTSTAAVRPETWSESLAALFDRLGRYEPAATIAAIALSPLTAAAVPEVTTAITHLRDELGEATYESLAARARR